MKKLLFYTKTVLCTALLLAANQSCTNLNEQVFDQVNISDFPNSDAEVYAVFGGAYSTLYNLMQHGNFFSVLEISSDEAMIPQRGGDWGDGGQWINVHRHEYKATDPNINNSWNFLYTGVNACNRVIFQLQNKNYSANIENQKEQLIAEMRMLRALYYFWLMDAFGNVPWVAEFSEDLSLRPRTTPRAEIFNNLTREISEVLPKLTKTKTYARFDYWAAKALEAKLYLNAEVYTGTAQWQKALDAANEIIASNNYSTEANYYDNFDQFNNDSKENIFVIPYDAVYGPGFNLGQMTLHYASQGTFELKEQPWNGYCSLQEFYNKYDNADVRKANFLAGQQFKSDGVTPVEDPSAEANDPDGKPLNFTPAINEHFPNALRQAGVRIGKYKFYLGATRNMSNDMPILRYADILLTKAEALWRLNPANTEALDIVNAIRTRANQPAFGSLTAQNLLDERGREMFYEGVRRQDLIRFGTFGNPTQFMPGSTDQKEIWPIPFNQRNINPELSQNPGY